MKEKTTILIVFMLLFLLSGCHGDFAKIKGRYAFSNGSIVLTDKEIDEFKYTFCGETYGIDFKIPSRVHDYDADSRYIVAFQIPDYSWYHDDFHTPNKSMDSLHIQFLQAKEIGFCFWIIDMNNDQVEGPMDKKKFMDECRKRDIQPNFWKSIVTDYLNL